MFQKLVNEVFQTMWFTPLSTRDKDSAKLIQRVINITEVVSTLKFLNFQTPENFVLINLKFKQRPNRRAFRQKDANEIANSEGPNLGLHCLTRPIFPKT